MAVAFICRRRPEILTVRLDTDYPNFNPVYLDDAKGMTPGSSQFDDFFGHYPIILKNGFMMGKINKNNFKKYENGTNTPTTYGYDTMIYFPRRRLSIRKVDEYIYVSIAKAHTGSMLLDRASEFSSGGRAFGYDTGVLGICVGAYEAYISDDKMCSTWGEATSTGYSMAQYRTFAQNKGAGYEMFNFTVMTYLQALYTIKYQAQNSQTTIGKGAIAYHETGLTDDKGMDWGDTEGTAVKLFGIEDFWGNHQTIVDGCMYNSSRQLLVAKNNFNSTGSGYENANSYAYTSNYDGFPDNITGTNLGGFTPYGTFSGNSTWYFCDRMVASQNAAIAHGGKVTDVENGNAGVYSLVGDKSLTSVFGGGMCARLTYMTCDW